jgi:ribonuclease HI
MQTGRMPVPDPVADSIRVYTDGACQGNPGPGGWGWAVDGGPYASGCEAASTNQRMEVWAAFDAVQTLIGNDATGTQKVCVVSDSTYVVNCFNKYWYKGWMSRGWKNSAKQPVANQDLWMPFIEFYLQHAAQITFEWVKGHSGNRMNDRVDELAVGAAASQLGRVLVDPTGWFDSTSSAVEFELAPADQPAGQPQQVSLF